MSRRSGIRSGVRLLEPPGGAAATLDHKATKLRRASRWDRRPATTARRNEKRWKDG